jgi:hypothetical protein
MPDEPDTEDRDWEVLRETLLPPRRLRVQLSDEVVAQLRRIAEQRGPSITDEIRRAISIETFLTRSNHFTVLAQAATTDIAAADPTVITRTLTDTVSVTDSVTVDVTEGADTFAYLEGYFQAILVFSFSLIYAWLIVWRVRGVSPTDELEMAKDVIDWCAGVYGLLLAARELQRRGK